MEDTQDQGMGESILIAAFGPRIPRSSGKKDRVDGIWGLNYWSRFFIENSPRKS